MIYTITLNPAIDHLLETNGFVINETNYYQNEVQIVGGKGINVAVLLKNLGTDSIPLGLLGDQNIEIFSKAFKQFKLQENFFTFKGKTRTNFKIKDLAANTETEINGQGEASNDDAKQVIEFLEAKLEPNDIVIASGSVPKNINPMIYYQIGMVANRKKAQFVLDSSKVWLKDALKTKPVLIKPNINEICEILERKYKQNFTFKEIQEMVEQLQTMGAQNVLISMGTQGSMYFEANGSAYKVNTATGSLVSSVGAGDSMVGGFVYGLVNNMSVEDTLTYAAASGAATAFSEWIGDKEKIETLKEQIKVKQVKTERGTKSVITGTF